MAAVKSRARAGRRAADGKLTRGRIVETGLALLAEQAGFRRVETRFLNEPPAEEQLREVELPPEAELDAAREALAQNVRRLNDQLFGPLDYAIVARR